jgi:long-chain fatty acid transport protein
MTIRFAHTPVACAIAGLLLTLAASPALGAGFQLNETSASGLGAAFAGGAAAAEDASTLWSNVAGLSRIQQRQGIAVLHMVKPSMEFGNVSSVAAAQQSLGGEGGDAGSTAWVPNLYYAAPINAQWSWGVGFTAPWGLVTEYEDGWMGRFQAIRSSIETMNVNPGVSWKPASNFALGFGLNYQRIEAEFTNQVNYSAALLAACAIPAFGCPPGSPTYLAIAGATPGLESGVRIEGDDDAWGWNAGLLWDISPQHRVGLHYRSSIKYTVEGHARFTNPTPSVPAPLAPTVAALAAAVNTNKLYDTGVTSEVEMPPIVNISLFSNINPQWDVMLDAQWTGWSTIKDLTFLRSDGSELASTPENFEDSWKLSVGANWRLGNGWMVRGGLAYDESPVQAAYRTPRLPDNDRTWLTAGGQYRFANGLTLDFGAAYIWVAEGSISKSGDPPDTALNGLLSGRYSSNTVILSAQLKMEF